jgi:DNA-binding CsgD family transcriptional regulator
MKRSSVRARIRQLCCLGVPAELLMVPLLPALRELIPSDLAGFFWVDSRGELRNLYVERLPPPELAPGCHSNSRDYETAFRKSFMACAEAPGEIATARAGNDYVLCAIARTRAGALGQLRLYRRAERGPFTESERADLGSVMHYVSHGIADAGKLPQDQFAFAFEDCDEEAMIVTDCAGTIHFASDKGLQLLLLATVRDIAPSALGPTLSEGASRAVKLLCSRLTAHSRGVEMTPAITLDSPWGRFVLRGYRLNNGEHGEARIGLRIQRQVPMILRFVDAMGRQALSPQQREIALQIALGRSNQEISAHMGVSLNTVAYHVKQLFLRLNVHTRTEAIEKIAWREPALEAG